MLPIRIVPHPSLLTDAVVAASVASGLGVGLVAGAALGLVVTVGR